MPPVQLDGARVSASRVRALLAAGEFVGAEPLLGRPFVIDGKVEYGNQLGRTLGYPTANIHLQQRVSPVHGIFAVRVGLGEGECSWPGVASLGVRPTVNQVSEPPLEVRLVDFGGDLFGQRTGRRARSIAASSTCIDGNRSAGLLLRPRSRILRSLPETRTPRGNARSLPPVMFSTS